MLKLQQQTVKQDIELRNEMLRSIKAENEAKELDNEVKRLKVTLTRQEVEKGWGWHK